MTAATAAERGRLAAQRLMVDTCTVTRPGAATVNETTGVVTRATTTVYTGACRVKPDAAPSETQSGEREVVVRRFIVSIPTSETGVEVDDVVTVTASKLDPALVGRALTVGGIVTGSHVTARRLVCVLTEN